MLKIVYEPNKPPVNLACVLCHNPALGNTTHTLIYTHTLPISFTQLTYAACLRTLGRTVTVTEEIHVNVGRKRLEM